MAPPSRGDLVVVSILDIIVEFKGWGPEAIQPDFALGRDLEMSSGDILEFARRLGEVFSTAAEVEFSSDTTLRQIASSIKNGMQSAA